MSKPPKRQKTKHAPVELNPELEQELGFILDRFKVQHPNGASLESYLQSLRSSLAGKELLAVALLERIGKHPGEVGFRLLQTLRDLFPSKMFRKAYRQAEYRFRQAGFGTEASATASSAAVLVPGEVRQPVAHMSPLSPDGHWFVSLLIPDEQRARTLVFALFAFPFQCVELRTGASSMGDYREAQKELSHNFLHPYVELPIWHAARIVLDCLESAVTADVHRDEAAVRRLVKPFYNPDRPAYAEERLPPLGEQVEAVTEEEAKTLLLNLPTQALTFPKEDLKPFYERVQALDHSVLIVNREVKEARARDIMADAADQLCRGQMRSSLLRFCEEQALNFHLLGQVEPAMTLWKTAGQLRSPEPASQIPVIVDLISASLYVHWHDAFLEAEAEEQKESESPTYQTDSGLILLR
jgi:hypothetical protein